MDFNEFSFEALFSSCDFERYDSQQLKKAVADLNKLLQSKFNFDVCCEIETASNRCCNAAQEAGFEQGFLFALRLMKKLYDMSFPDIPPLLK